MTARITGSRIVDTPVGRLTLTASHGAIKEVAWLDGEEDGNDPVLDEAVRQVRDYFDGRLIRFDLPLAPSGTPFQHRVWTAMAEIPFGQTRSYGELAHIVDSGPRAIGTACARNPIPLVVPCHRVVAAGGALGGFSGGAGLGTKRWLLGHEAQRMVSQRAATEVLV